MATAATAEHPQADAPPRYRVSILEGFPILPGGRTGGADKPVTDVHVWDHHYVPPALAGFFRSSAIAEGTGGRHLDGSRRPPTRLGREGAIRAAEELCATVNRAAIREAGLL